MMPETIMRHINETFPEAIIATDVGQNQLWVTQFLEMDEHKQLLTSGALVRWGMAFRQG